MDEIISTAKADDYGFLYFDTVNPAIKYSTRNVKCLTINGTPYRFCGMSWDMTTDTETILYKFM